MRSLHFDGTAVSFNPNTPDPVPAEGEVLVRVHTAGLCQTDLEIAKGYMAFTGILGHEFVGTVTKLGKNTKADLMGRRVVAEINCVCGKCEMCNRGLSSHCTRRTVMGILNRSGAFADLIRVPARNVHVVPDHIRDEEAVFVEPLAAAFQILRQVPIEKRTRVTVLGDGRLGQLVVQALAGTGCPLTLVGHHEDKLTLAEKVWKSLNSETRNPKSETCGTFRTTLEKDVRSARDQDVVIDCTGQSTGLERAFSLVRPRGIIVLKTTTAPGGKPVHLAPIVIDEISVIGSRCGPFPDALAALAARQVNVAGLISRRVTLAQAPALFPPNPAPHALKILFTING
jgi:alcohol dehydrogenase